MALVLAMQPLGANARPQFSAAVCVSSALAFDTVSFLAQQKLDNAGLELSYGLVGAITAEGKRWTVRKG